MRVLILGGTGFIGPAVVRLLAEQGNEITLYHRGKIFLARGLVGTAAAAATLEQGPTLESARAQVSRKLIIRHVDNGQARDRIVRFRAPVLRINLPGKSGFQTLA